MAPSVRYSPKGRVGYVPPGSVRLGGGKKKEKDIDKTLRYGAEAQKHRTKTAVSEAAKDRAARAKEAAAGRTSASKRAGLEGTTRLMEAGLKHGYTPNMAALKKSFGVGGSTSTSGAGGVDRTELNRRILAKKRAQFEKGKAYNIAKGAQDRKRIAGNIRRGVNVPHIGHQPVGGKYEAFNPKIATPFATADPKTGAITRYSGRATSQDEADRMREHVRLGQAEGQRAERSVAQGEVIQGADAYGRLAEARAALAPEMQATMQKLPGGTQALDSVQDPGVRGRVAGMLDRQRMTPSGGMEGATMGFGAADAALGARMRDVGAENDAAMARMQALYTPQASAGPANAAQAYQPYIPGAVPQNTAATGMPGAMGPQGQAGVPGIPQQTPQQVPMPQFSGMQPQGIFPQQQEQQRLPAAPAGPLAGMYPQQGQDTVLQQQNAPSQFMPIGQGGGAGVLSPLQAPFPTPDQSASAPAAQPPQQPPVYVDAVTGGGVPGRQYDVQNRRWMDNGGAQGMPGATGQQGSMGTSGQPQGFSPTGEQDFRRLSAATPEPYYLQAQANRAADPVPTGGVVSPVQVPVQPPPQPAAAGPTPLNLQPPGQPQAAPATQPQREPFSSIPGSDPLGWREATMQSFREAEDRAKKFYAPGGSLAAQAPGAAPGDGGGSMFGKRMETPAEKLLAARLKLDIERGDREKRALDEALPKPTDLSDTDKDKATDAFNKIHKFEFAEFSGSIGMGESATSESRKKAIGKMTSSITSAAVDLGKSSANPRQAIGKFRSLITSSEFYKKSMGTTRWLIDNAIFQAERQLGIQNPEKK